MPWVDPASRATGYKVTASNWDDFVANFNYLAEIGYAEVTSPVTVTVTTVGTATQAVTLGSITYEAVPTLLEFHCPRVSVGANTLNVILRDGTTVLGTLATFATGAAGFLYAARRLTPTAAAHSYNVACWNGAAATATLNAGTGGVAGDSTTFLPMWIRATRLPT
jgi:hypothetical protein